MKELFAALADKAKGNPAGVALATCSIAIYGGGEALSGVHLEPWGTILQGIAGVLCLVAGAWVSKKDK